MIVTVPKNATVGTTLHNAPTGTPLIWPRLGGAGAVLTALDERIRAGVEPMVQQAQNDLAAIVVVELGKIGITPELTSMAEFVRGIADNYRENLVAARIAAVVDSMVTAVPPTAE